MIVAGGEISCPRVVVDTVAGPLQLGVVGIGGEHAARGVERCRKLGACSGGVGVAAGERETRAQRVGELLPLLDVAAVNEISLAKVARGGCVEILADLIENLEEVV